MRFTFQKTQDHKQILLLRYDGRWVNSKFPIGLVTGLSSTTIL